MAGAGMTGLFLLDIPENLPVVEVADASPAVSVSRVGPYFQVQADDEISIDRRATGCRHAVWYSCVAGVAGGRIVQWDKDALRVGRT